MGTGASLKLQNISKIYESPGAGGDFKAVDAISLDIKPGEFITLLGPSGCGKTTTLRMIAGFEIPNDGVILLEEKDISALSPDKRNTAMVFQSYAIFPHMNIWDNIAYGLKLKKLPKAEISRKVQKIIELTGLEGMEKRRPNQISGGQQQRVALARALVMEPAVLLFDEPLSNLDAKLRATMRTEIRRIQQTVGITAVYVTHDQAEAMSLSDRIVIMNKGKIEQAGSPLEIYCHPNSEFTANFIGTANFLDGEIGKGGSTVRIAGVEVPLQEAGKTGKCKIMLRPEAILVGENGKIPAKVLSSTFMGNYQDYRLSYEGGELCAEVSNPMAQKTFLAGDSVMLDFTSGNLHIL